MHWAKVDDSKNSRSRQDTPGNRQAWIEESGGKLHGERTWFPTTEYTTETATMLYAPYVARVVVKYNHGQQGAFEFYDADGNAIDPQDAMK